MIWRKHIEQQWENTNFPLHCKKKNSWNQLYMVLSNVDFAEFLSKKCVREFPEFLTKSSVKSTVLLSKRATKEVISRNISLWQKISRFSTLCYHILKLCTTFNLKRNRFHEIFFSERYFFVFPHCGCGSHWILLPSARIL